jgi:cyclic pyranopterin phosphate synthase
LLFPAKEPEQIGRIEMSLRSNAFSAYFKYVKPHAGSNSARQAIALLKNADRKLMSLKYSLAKPFPRLLDPSITQVKLALTSNCNHRCEGCLYGRSFLPGECIDFNTLKRALDDMAELRVSRVHFHGGEPLLHPDIRELISYSRSVGITPSLGSNAMALSKSKIDDLYARGLRAINVGIYGVGDAYDEYVGHAQRFKRLKRNLSYIREQYPDVDLTLAWLLMRPTCTVDAVRGIRELSQDLKVSFGVVLIQYDFPYFTDGEGGKLQLFEEDRPMLEEVSRELLRLKKLHPDLISTPVSAIAAIPDWIIRKGENNIPCYMDDTVFILPNGDVYVCPKSQSIGNVNHSRFKDIVHTDTHKRAVRNCLELNCPNCNFRYDMRTELNGESRRRYEAIANGSTATSA